MSAIHTAITLCRHPIRLIEPLGARGLLNLMPDALFLKLVFKAHFGKPLNLKDPATFSEKLQWLKLYYHRPDLPAVVDKYRVRERVAETIGEQYLVPLIGVWTKAEDIDFDALPDRFVLKCNHDQGSVVICPDKASFDVPKAKKKLSRKLRLSQYWGTREWPYKPIRPCILCEQFLEGGPGEEGIADYKVLCFHGVPKLIEVHHGRFGKKHTQDFYDPDWNKTAFAQPAEPPSDEVMPGPPFAQEMLSLSARLSEGYPHVRVDWYYVGGRLYFSELTFFDGSGFYPFLEGQDEQIGSWLTLPEKIV